MNVDSIFKECKMKGQFFSFFDIPDHLIKLKLSKVDMDNVVEVLKEAKEVYMESKAEIQNVKIEEIQITDEDLVPLDILTEMLRRRADRKQQDHEFIRNYLRKCQTLIIEKIRELNVENDKIKKVIESNVVIGYLNEKTQFRHEEIFSQQHKFKIMALVMSKQRYKSAKDVKRKFDEIMSLNKENNVEFRNSLMKEMGRFNGSDPFETDFTESIDQLSGREFRALATPEKDKTNLDMNLTGNQEEDDLIDALNAAKNQDEHLLMKDEGENQDDSIFNKDQSQFKPNESLPDFGVNLDKTEEAFFDPLGNIEEEEKED